MTDNDADVKKAAINAENQERDRIAHELHDNINQMLGSVQLYLSRLDKDNLDFELVRNRAAQIMAPPVLYEALHYTKYAVTVAPASAVHLGPSGNSTIDRTFSRGSKVEVIDSYGEWLEVKDAPNTPGWIRKSDVSVTD